VIIRRPLMFLSLLGLMLSAGLSANNVVYTEPTRRIVLNEVIAASPENVTFPLYLRDAGRYITELYLSNIDGEVDRSHDQTIRVEVKIDITRKGKILKSESKQIAFSPGQANHTLFWTRTPFDLPQRKNLDMTVTIAGVDNMPLAASQAFRVQMTRKFEFTPIVR
jgi:hypothetical protein